MSVQSLGLSLWVETRTVETGDWLWLEVWVDTASKHHVAVGNTNPTVCRIWISFQAKSFRNWAAFVGSKRFRHLNRIVRSVSGVGGLLVKLPALFKR